MRPVKFFLSFLKNALLFSIFALSLIPKNAMKPLEHSTSCFRLPTVASASLGDVLRPPFCRFASLRGGTTKQSRPRIEKMDCFTAFANALHSTESKTRIESTVDCFVPRNDAKRVWGRSPVIPASSAASASSQRRITRMNLKILNLEI